MTKAKGRKIESPYQRLQREARQWVFAVLHPRRVLMFVLDKAKVRGRTTWALDDVYERVAAAEALGWDVRLTIQASDGALRMEYVQRPASAPWEIAP